MRERYYLKLLVAITRCEVKSLIPDSEVYVAIKKEYLFIL